MDMIHFSLELDEERLRTPSFVPPNPHLRLPFRIVSYDNYCMFTQRFTFRVTLFFCPYFAHCIMTVGLHGGPFHRLFLFVTIAQICIRSRSSLFPAITY